MKLTLPKIKLPAIHASDLAYLAGEAVGIAGVLSTPAVGTLINSLFHTTIGTAIVGGASLVTLLGSKLIRVQTNPAGGTPPAPAPLKTAAVASVLTPPRLFPDAPAGFGPFSTDPINPVKPPTVIPTVVPAAAPVAAPSPVTPTPTPIPSVPSAPATVSPSTTERTISDIMAALNVASLSSDLSLAVTIAQAIVAVEAGTPQPISIPVPAETFSFNAGPLGTLQISTAAVTLTATITKTAAA